MVAGFFVVLRFASNDRSGKLPETLRNGRCPTRTTAYFITFLLYPSLYRRNTLHETQHSVSNELFPMWLKAGGWGLFTGSGLLLGALAGYFLKLPQRLIAGALAFGSGTLFFALFYELVIDAYRKGGFWPTATGFLVGAVVFSMVSYWLNQQGAKHRKRSGEEQPGNTEGSGLAIAAGSFLDGVPESIVVGLSMLSGEQSLSTVAIGAIFVSNLPEGLVSAAGLKQSGRSWRYVGGLWLAIVLAYGIAAAIGYLVFARYSQETVSVTIAIAAGAMLAMVVDTMVPEAYNESHEFSGLITVIGFLLAFWFSTVGA